MSFLVSLPNFYSTVDIVECLVDAGAAINDQGGTHCNGISPLMDAACNGHLDIVTVLVDKGAQLDLKDINVRYVVLACILTVKQAYP